MKKNKFDFLGLLLSLFLAVFALDFAKQHYFTPRKNYKIILKDGAIIEGNFFNGLIAYDNINYTIYKWEISSIKEIQ